MGFLFLIYLIISIFFCVFFYKKAKNDNLKRKDTFFAKLWYEDVATGLTILFGIIWIIFIPIYFLIILFNKISNKLLNN